MSDRKGPWFLTFTGRQIYPFDMRAEDIDIADIAHSLSLQCRFNGHCREFYSVGLHSIYVAYHLPQELKFVGLLHDATEAYVGDMIRPLKRAIPEFERIETEIWYAICERFRLPYQTLPREVKEADSRMLMTERRDLLTANPAKWEEDQVAGGEGIEPYGTKIRLIPPEWTEEEFLVLFNDLTSSTLSTLR